MAGNLLPCQGGPLAQAGLGAAKLLVITLAHLPGINRMI